MREKQIMGDNVWVFVCIYGGFGEELMKSVEMVAGETGNVFTFPLTLGMQPEDYRAILGRQLEELGDNKVLCLVGLSGGTPCTTCAILSKAYDMQVISGLNLVVYIEVTPRRNLHPRQELVKIGLEILRGSGKDVIKLFNERK